MTLEKPPWGKPVREIDIYGDLKQMLQRKNEPKEPDTKC
jgi:hypothetical protein